MFIVGGTFDKNGGKPSHFISEMMTLLDISGINGGDLATLEIDFSFTSVLIWMPNIDNGEDKILPTLKVKYPHMLLIQSKRVDGGKYTDFDVIGRLLKSHSLLGISIDRSSGSYEFKLLDPLGNLHCKTNDLEVLCRTLRKRIYELTNMTRMGSKSVGEVNYFTIEPKFIEIVKNFGQKFATFVNAINPNRLLGNASTRCMSGFPAVRENDRIFVSKRNVDKQSLSSEDFVESSLQDKYVEYYGDNKPSVDTPVQLLLFSYFPNIRYMIHGHVYVEGAPMTVSKIPCGFLEEILDIMVAIRDRNIEEFSVNLRGHGCIMACKDLAYFDTVKLESRPFPEA